MKISDKIGMAAGIMALAVAGCALIAARETPGVIEAHAFKLVDFDGNRRGALAMTPGGDPMLVLERDDGSVAVMVSGGDVATVSIWDHSGVARLKFAVGEIPSVSMTDRKDRLRFGLSTGNPKREYSKMVLFNANEEPVWIAP